MSTLFAPIICVWFAALAGIGIYNIVQAPEVLVAFSPHFAILYFVSKGYAGTPTPPPPPPGAAERGLTRFLLLRRLGVARQHRALRDGRRGAVGARPWPRR